MAVALDSSGSVTNSELGGTSININTVTFGAGANRFAVFALHLSNQSVTGVSVAWDNLGTPQAATLIGSWNSPGATGRLDLFGLIAPTSTTGQAHAQWTGISDGALGCIEFSGVDQTTPYVAAHTLNANGTSGTPSITITSSVDGATVGANADQAASAINSTTGGTELYRNNDINPRYAMSYTIGGTSNAHSWTDGGTPSWVIAGVHIQAVQAAGPVLWAQSVM